MVTRLGNKVTREAGVMCSLTPLLNGISVFLAVLLLTSLMLVYERGRGHLMDTSVHEGHINVIIVK